MREKDRGIWQTWTWKQFADEVRVCSLGQITHALFEVGGQYRRSR
jgi:hypothetical protein